MKSKNMCALGVLISLAIFFTSCSKELMEESRRPNRYASGNFRLLVPKKWSFDEKSDPAVVPKDFTFKTAPSLGAARGTIRLEKKADSPSDAEIIKGISETRIKWFDIGPGKKIPVPDTLAVPKTCSFFIFKLKSNMFALVYRKDLGKYIATVLCVADKYELARVHRECLDVVESMRWEKIPSRDLVRASLRRRLQPDPQTRGIIPERPAPTEGKDLVLGIIVAYQPELRKGFNMERCYVFVEYAAPDGTTNIVSVCTGAGFNFKYRLDNKVWLYVDNKGRAEFGR